MAPASRKAPPRAIVALHERRLSRWQQFAAAGSKQSKLDLYQERREINDSGRSPVLTAKRAGRMNGHRTKEETVQVSPEGERAPVL